jgi:hypothetical protein
MLHMLQWLYTYVSSVCSKYFILFFRRMFANVSSECWICFHTCEVFSCIFCKCFNCFVRMLQMFHLDVSKVDQVLQLIFQMHVSCV